MRELFTQVSEMCSEMVTRSYSTSFYSAINLLHKDLRQPVWNIYGFVRFADEIVDTLHEQDKQSLLTEFEADTWKAIERKVSLNPVLNSFQKTVNEYSIDHELIRSFLYSMQLDLNKSIYPEAADLKEYIYGSAEVVGLMCLYVFCEGDLQLFEELKMPAMQLGSAFQKINFLRDLKTDKQLLNRSYFPGVDPENFTREIKLEIEKDILKDFDDSLTGLRRLPWKSRYGVYTAYKYYKSLFHKIRQTDAEIIMERRVRVADYQKFIIMLRARLGNKLNIIR